jgi:hypothetical protein
MPGGIGLPTLLLVIQLGVGLLAAGDLVRSLARRRVGLFTVGQVLTAVVLIALGADGLFFGTDLVGRIGYELNLEPTWIRPGTIGLIVVGALLWGLDR